MEATRSRQLIAQASRALWGTAQTDEEARRYLQTRFTLYTKLMFTSMAMLLVFVAGMYWFFDTRAPANNDLIFSGSAAALVVMAFIWRAVLVRKELSVIALYRLDVVYALCIGGAFAGSAALAHELQVAAYMSMVYACFTVFTRALVVPSTGTRTAFVSSLTFAPMVAAGLWLGINVKQEVPNAAFVVGAILFSAIAVVLATTGSSIIYDLRHKVSEAMRLGQYMLDRRIGAGGNGEVYRAHHAMLRRDTAIKLLLPDKVGAENLDRFEREVQMMSRLTHPNTVSVFDYGRSAEGILYYAMEYLPGIDLEKLVRFQGRQPANRVIDIMIQVCGALQEAHDLGLIHRDIKPGNIILCERGGMPDVAKVVDYGLVKELTRDTSASGQAIPGTPGYVAPEALTDPDAVGPAVDLYALGAVGYFLLTGRQVFAGKTAVDVMLQHVKEQPERPSVVAPIHVSRELENAIMRCLAKQPGDRFASAHALAEALEVVPRARDWDREEARRWWRDFRAKQSSPATSDTPTLTITVDIGQRGARSA
jgi:serine/threonine-protein kinase